MQEFWYDYVKPRYTEKSKLFYMDTDSFIVYIKNVFMNRLQKMFQQGLTTLIISWKVHY